MLATFRHAVILAAKKPEQITNHQPDERWDDADDRFQTVRCAVYKVVVEIAFMNPPLYGLGSARTRKNLEEVPRKKYKP